MLVSNAENIRILRRYQGAWILNFFNRLRLRYIEMLRDLLGKRQGNLIAALLLGARRLLSFKTVERFRFAGVIHLLAISGLHISIVTFLIYQALRRIMLPRAFCQVLLMISSALYALLTELQPPVVRAVLMIWIYLLSCRIGRSRR